MPPASKDGTQDASIPKIKDGSSFPQPSKPSMQKTHAKIQQAARFRFIAIPLFVPLYQKFSAV
jgi:hypothetical protein